MDSAGQEREGKKEREADAGDSAEGARRMIRNLTSKFPTEGMGMTEFDEQIPHIGLGVGNLLVKFRTSDWG